MTDPAAPSGNPASNSPPQPATEPVVDPANPAPPQKPADPAPPAPPTPKAPEKYDFKAPEGYELDKGAIEALTPVLKELDLDQAQASKLVNTYLKHQVAAEAKLEKAFTDDMAAKAAANLQAIRTEWGAQHDTNMALARDGMTKVFTAEAVRKLDETGLGNDPDFLKGFLKVGRMVSEDKRTPSGNPTVTTILPLEQRLYPSMNSQAS